MNLLKGMIDLKSVRKKRGQRNEILIIPARYKIEPFLANHLFEYLWQTNDMVVYPGKRLKRFDQVM